MQGFNMGRYVPPDQEGVRSGNQLHGKRASPTVRFEMPFAMWCGHCPGYPDAGVLIGQGVRFNAEKRRVGSYHSTPVWAFRMRHPLCGGAIEIRTDPANTAYVVAEGGRRRDTGDGGAADSLLAGGPDFAIPTAQEQADAREQAFSHLEKTIADRERLVAAGERLDELEDASARHWDDPYARNQLLRKTFRVGRKERARIAADAEDVRDRYALDMELLAPSEEDARRAKLIDFGSAPEGSGAGGDNSDLVSRKVLAKPLVMADAGQSREHPVKDSSSAQVQGLAKAVPSTKVPKLKSEIAASKTRQSLVSEVVGNTRLSTDPFLEPRSKTTSKPSALVPGLKRKRDGEVPPEPRAAVSERTLKPAASTALVAYDSDTE